MLALISLVCVLVLWLRLRLRTPGVAVIWGLAAVASAALAFGEHVGILVTSAKGNTWTATALRGWIGYEGNDDYLFVGFLLVTALAVLVLDRLEEGRPAVRAALAAGYLLQIVHLLVETGDGEFFSMPLLSLAQLGWLEEVLELLSLTCYFGAILLVYLRLRSVGRSVS